MVFEMIITRFKARNHYVTDHELYAPFAAPLLDTSVLPRITWIGHSSFLIQLQQVNIITDPIFDKVTYFFPRLNCKGITLDQIPSIDVVLISHNHLDHMNKPALHAIAQKNPQVTFLVPMGNRSWFERHGFERVQEFMWWQDSVLSFSQNNRAAQIIFTFLPANHWSQRSLFDRNKTLWGSWMVTSDDFSIYFAGDTAYGNHFKEISQDFTNINVALLPIGPCEPQHMRASHTDANEAGMAFLDLNAQHFVPMHWGTYPFGDDSVMLPVARLQTWWHQHIDHVLTKQLHILPFNGQLYFQKKDTLYTPSYTHEQQLFR